MHVLVIITTTAASTDDLEKLDTRRAPCARYRYVAPLCIACRSKDVRIQDTALSSLENAIAMGFIRGNDREVEPSSEHHLLPSQIKEIVAAICFTCENIAKGRTGLQSIKAANSLAMSNIVKVHGHNTMNLIKALMHVTSTAPSAHGVVRNVGSSSLEQITCVALQRASIRRQAVVESEDEKNYTVGDDAALVLVSLSNLSTADALSDDMPASPGQSALALNVLRAALSRLTPSLRTESVVVDALKSHICKALLKHSVSKHANVLRGAIRVFYELMSSYRTVLHDEIEILLCDVFLGILESENASVERKVQVLKLFTRLSEDGRSLVELLLMYDCGAISDGASGVLRAKAGDGLIERVATALASVARRQSGVGKRTSFTKTERIALSALINMTNAVATYANDCEESRRQEANVDVSDGHAGEATEVEDAVQDDAVSNVNDSTETKNGKSADARALDKTTNVSKRDLTNAEESLEHRRVLQRHLDSAFEAFGKKAKRGIAYLTSRGLLDSTSDAVAEFLWRYRDDLSKSQTGEYLGSDAAFNVSVMHAYIDRNQFRGMELDKAVRALLSGFRLPGESQKIDRIMEKFADRYVSCNGLATESSPSDSSTSVQQFQSADDAFALSFAIIMLQTDLHSDQIRADRKMTVEKFISLCRDFNAPEAYLRGIYKRIKDEPITLIADERQKIRAKKTKLFKTRNIFRSKIARQNSDFAKESALMIREAEERLRSGLGNRASEHAVEVDLSQLNKFGWKQLRPFLKIVWRPTLMAVHSFLVDGSGDNTASSSTFSSSTDDNDASLHSEIDTAFKGMYSAIKIACRSAMDQVSDAFVHEIVSLTTMVPSTGGQHPIRVRSTLVVSALRTILSVAETEGSNLSQDAWFQVLQCITNLSFATLLYEKSQLKALSDPSHTRSIANAQTKMLRDAKIPIDRGQLAAVTKSLDSCETSKAIDRIFETCSKYTCSQLKNVLTSLVLVSRAEISNREYCKSNDKWMDEADPMTFATAHLWALRRAVDIVRTNMDTFSRFEWRRMWPALAKHLSSAACDARSPIALFAVDALKQISIRFLAKNELRGFSFQSAMLQPFSFAMRRSKSSKVREMIVLIQEHVVRSRGDKLRSGWRSLLAVLAFASDDSSGEIPRSAFRLLTHIIETHLTVLPKLSELAYHTNALIKCVAAFSLGSQGDEDTARAAIELLGDLGRKLIEGVAYRDRVREEKDDDESCRIVNRFFEEWMESISELLFVSDVETRMLSLKIVIDVLIEAANVLQPDVWNPLFTDAVIPVIQRGMCVVRKDGSTWFQITGVAALNKLTFLVSDHFGAMSSSIPNFVNMLIHAARSQYEHAPSASLSCIECVNQIVESATCNDVLLPARIFVELSELLLWSATYTNDAFHDAMTKLTGALIKSFDIGMLRALASSLRRHLTSAISVRETNAHREASRLRDIAECILRASFGRLNDIEGNDNSGNESYLSTVQIIFSSVLDFVQRRTKGDSLQPVEPLVQVLAFVIRNITVLPSEDLKCALMWLRGHFTAVFSLRCETTTRLLCQLFDSRLEVSVRASPVIIKGEK